jgi:aspartate racemase
VDLGNPAVVSFNENGDRPPVVFFHTWDNEVDHLRALAGFLGPRQPLYGIEPPTAGKTAMPECVDDWIAHHRPMFDSLPVDPPYYLAGFSFGGVLALEIARHLEDEGVEVAWLGLVDAMRPRLNPKGIAYLRYHVQELRALPTKDARRRYTRRLVRSGRHRSKIRVKVRIHRILARLHVVKSKPKSFSEAEGMSSLKRSVFRSYLTYEATPYNEPVALFSGAGSRETALGDVTLRWSNFLTGGLEVTEIDGKHLELFSPQNIHSVGEAIRDSLARRQGIKSTRPNAERLSR